MVFLGANVERFFFEVLDSQDQFHLVNLTGSEAVSTLYQVNIEVVCESPDIKLDSLIGQAAVVTIMDQDSDAEEYTRFIHGIINRVEIGEEGVEQTTYYITLVPKIWPLTYRNNNRIFQDMSVPDIIEQVLLDAGLSADEFEFALSGSYEPREYCVQYREDEFNFIQRLMEDEGIHFYFEHQEDKHILHLCDQASGNPPIGPSSDIEYYRDGQGAVREQHIFRFRYSESVTPGKVTLRDFDFKRPNAQLQVSKEGDQDHNADLEIYDYPGIYLDSAKGERLADIRLKSLSNSRCEAQGESDVNLMNPGHVFKLFEHEREELNIEYLITQVEHVCAQPQVLQAGASTEGSRYGNIFTCIPADTDFRPSHQARRPFVRGSQTAIVVGPSGEEIYTDEHGRVKLQFHWDREGKSDENSSCWVRVGQASTGAGFGSMFIPRIGEEVIVDFLEGDPDKPIIVGRVYHGVNRPPYELPKDKTKSTIKTNTSPDGGGYNELRFEDKKGEEQIFIHAEKDVDKRVKNSNREYIGNNSDSTIAKNRNQNIGEDKTLNIGGEEFFNIAGDSHRNFGAKLITNINADEDKNIADQLRENIGGDKHLTIVSNENTTVGKNKSLDVGQTINIKAGTKVVVESGTEITLSAGGSFITIGPKGVNISGPMVNAIASGILTLKGSLTKVNSGGSAGSAGKPKIVKPDTPEKPKDPKDPEEARNSKSGRASSSTNKAMPRSPAGYSPQAQAMLYARQSGTPFCEQCRDAES